MTFNLSDSTDYRIVTFSDLENILSKEGKSTGSFDDQLETNYCYVYYLKSGEVALVPSQAGLDSKVLIIANRQRFQNYKDTEYFPIQNENVSIEEIFSKEVLNIQQTVASILNLYFENQQFGVDDKLIEQFLDNSNHTFKKGDLKQRFRLGILLGESIKRKTNAKWGVMKQYGIFNPYYTPVLIYPDDSFIILRDWISRFFDTKHNTVNWLFNFISVARSCRKVDVLKNNKMFYGGLEVRFI